MAWQRRRLTPSVSWNRNGCRLRPFQPNAVDTTSHRLMRLTSSTARPFSRRATPSHMASTTDALGWTHETMQALYRQPHGQKLLLELQVLYATRALGREATDIFNSCLAIPLKKSRDGTSLRPIAIPTVFRKGFARICVAKFCPELQETAGPHQYAAMCADGGRKPRLH